MIYVLDGGAPGKVAYFTERNKIYPNEVKLLDNCGDKENAFNLNYLVNNCNPDDKIIIISEYQLNYIQSKLDRYEKILGNMIYLRSSKSKDINYLASKELFTELPNLGKDSFILNNLYHDDYISDPNYIVKECSSTGSNGVFYNNRSIIEGTEFNENKKYLVQPIYELNDWNFYSVPSIIKDSKLICCIPLRNYERFNSVVGSLSIDSDVLPLMRSAFDELIDKLGLLDGVCEPEFVINKKTNEIRIIDLNPRWSLDCSTSTKIVNEEYNNDFDFLNSYLNGIEFFPTKNSSLYRLGRAYYKV